MTRNTLPDVPIVYTLHEYLPICHHNGQMVRTMDTSSLCTTTRRDAATSASRASPQQTFFMRKRFIQSQFGSWTCSSPPRECALEQYVRLGHPARADRARAARLRAGAPLAGARRRARTRNRFGFFGQFTDYKGADVLLEAMRCSPRRGLRRRLWIHGANLDTSAGKFQDQFRELLEDSGDRCTLAGQYDRADIAKLMARVDWVVIPSIWWETCPLVVAGGVPARRPVICSDIGGMSEKVTDGVNGLHFRARRSR